ncbi:MAG: hypothetical protein R3185_05255, partial [Candidatus Thermoplasmatota archaeon]|nr:hypothetical protein [Candidatus Thermoplasmatota archaeon]
MAWMRLSVPALLFSALLMMTPAATALAPASAPVDAPTQAAHALADGDAARAAALLAPTVQTPDIAGPAAALASLGQGELPAREAQAMWSQMPEALST